ncbi:MAG: YihY/virulence factor BrkB family protein [Flexilinea sp.]
MLKSNTFENLKKEHNRNKISPAEMEKKKAIRIDAILSVTIDAITSLIKTHPAQAAASISYYSLFSIFPLMLFMIVVLSYFLERTVIQQEIILILENFLPGSETLVIENLQNILSSRFTTSLTASITLLWSGSGVFNCVIANVHMAWPESRGRGYFINRAFAIGAIILIFVILAVTMFFSAFFSLSDALGIFDIRINEIIEFLVNATTGFVLPLLLVYFAAYVIYYFVPAVKVDKKGAQIGALITTIFWRIFTYFFSIYVLSPFNTYDVIYGSVAIIILLLLYVYIMSFFILFSAHLVASITHYKQKQIERAQKTGEINTFEQPVQNRAKLKTDPKERVHFKTAELIKQGKFARKLPALKSNVRSRISHISLPKLQIFEKIASIEKNEKTKKVKKIAHDSIRNLFRWK